MKCPNCQKEIPANSKFCTYCGFQIPQVQATNGGGTQPVQPQFGPSQAQFDNTNQQPNFAQNNQQSFNQSAQPNPTMEQTTAYAKNYWAYLVHGVKHPSDIDVPFHKYFGLVSLLTGSLLLALTLLMVEIHLAGGIFSDIANFTNTDSVQGRVGFGMFMGVLILTIITAFFTYSMTHLVTRGFLGDKTANYMEDMTRYYHISSLGLMVLAVGFILSILGSFAIPLVAICVGFYGIMNSISFVALIFRAHPTNNFDRVYAYLVGLIVMGIAGVILYTLLLSILGASAISSLGDLF
ncbi:hypothetical protein FD04_GL000533 [Secundilactobacillus odoratitofui DSM 19909 = JCM 15043]|uniref:Zinc-ribbon domain-containing protein n=2 Tax=Secundilactobacillus odoratitofui TaxID=480930 RepID=A0A0R1LTP5_9LACO|nr:zinc ribbon domain-containing protein [Secundilactobacillus odoratitofui]KRK98792.1 hypothetical protein FD04_GL000533 [Secundilactobacillus odoratitofui DSM 19909 = JCM 15043]